MKAETLLSAETPPSVTVECVLVVDASVDDINGITRLIRQHRGSSVRVVTATTILDALREYRHEKPDCVLIDHRLADGEGIELMHMLNEISAPLPAPVIYMASSDSPRLAIRVLKAGATDYLSKSWLEAESLFKAIEKAVERTAANKARIQRRLDIEEANRNLQEKVLSLQETDRLRRQISGLAPTFLYVRDVVEDRNVYANQTMLANLGYSEKEWAEMNPGVLRRLAHPEDVETLLNQLKNLSGAKDGAVSEMKLRLKRRDGSFIQLNLRETVFLRDPNGRVWQVVGTGEEQNENDKLLGSLQHQSTALEEEIQNLNAVWDQDLIGIAVTSGKNSKDVRINPLMQKWLELDETVALSDLAKAFGFTVSSSSFGKAASKGISAHNVERNVFQTDGHSLHVRETVHPLLDADGKPRGFVAYFTPAGDQPTAKETSTPKEVSTEASDERLAELQAKLDAAESARKQAEEKLAFSEEIAEKLQDALANLHSQPVAPVSGDVDVEARIAEATDRAKQAESRFEELETRWRETLELLLTADENREKLTARQNALQTELTAKSKEFSTLSKKAEEDRKALETEVARHADLVAKAQEESAALRLTEADRTALLAEKEVETVELQTKLEQYAQELKDKLDIADQMVALRTELERNLALKADAEALAASHGSRYETVEAEKLDLETRFTALTGEHETLQGSLGAEKAERLRLLAQIDDLTAQSKTLNEQLTEAGSLADQLKVRAAQADELEAIQADDRKALHELATHVAELQAQLGEGASRESSLGASFEASQAELTKLVEEIRRLGDVNQAKIELEGQLSSLQDEHESLQGAIGSEKTERLRLLAQVDDLTNQSRQVAEKLESTEAERARITQEEAAARTQIETHIAEIARLEKIGADSSDERLKLEDELRETLANLETHVAQAAVVQEQLAAKSSEFEEHKNEHARVAGELETATASLAEMTERGRRVEELEGLLATAETTVVTSGARVTVLENQLRATQTKLHDGEERWWKTYKEAENRERQRAEAVEQLEAANSDLEMQKAKLAELQEAVNEAESQLSEVNRTAPESQHLLKELTERFNALQSNHEALQAEADRRLTERDDLDRQYADLDRQHGDLVEQFETQQVELGELKTSIAATEARLAEASAAKESGQRQLAALQADAKLTSQREKELTDSYKKLHANASRLETDRDELAKRLQALTEQLTNESAKTANSGKVAKELKAVAEKELAAREELRKLAESLAEANAKLESLSAHESELAGQLQDKSAALESIQTELSGAKSQYETLTTRERNLVDQLGSAQGEERRLSDELAQATSKIEALSAQKADLDAQFQGNLQALQAAQADLAEKNSRVEALSTREGELTGNLQKGAEALANAQGQLAEKSAEAEALSSRQTELTTQLAAAEAEQRRLADALQMSQEELKSAQGNLNNTQDEIRKKLASTEELLRAKTAEALGHAEEAKKLTAALQKVETEQAELRSHLGEKERQINEKTEQLNAAQVELLGLKLSFKQSETARIAAEERIPVLEADLAKTTSALADTQSRLDQASKELKAASAEIGKLNAEVARQKQALEQAKAQLQEATNQLETARAEIRTLKADLEQKTKELQESEKNLERALQELTKSEDARKRAQDELRAANEQLAKSLSDLRIAEERYRSLSTLVPCVVFTTNSLGVVDYVNGKWQELTGVTMVDAQAGDWKDLVHKDDFTAFLKEWTNGVRSGDGFTLNLRIKRKDGQFRWHTLQNTPERDGDRISRWLGTLTEIHEQVTSREAARQARMRYGAMLDNTSESVLFLSTSGYVLGASKASLNLLRQGSEAVVGTPLWETKWWLKAEEAKLLDAVRQAAAGNTTEIETVRIDTERQHRPAKMTLVPVKDENDVVSMVVSHFKDL